MEQIKVDTADLTPGMYVAELDRPWTDTPFVFQGFLIEKKQQISRLQQYCEYVYIDAEQGKSPPATSSAAGSTDMESRAERAKLPLPKPAVRYEDKCPVEQELKTARQVQAAINESVSSLMEKVRNEAAFDLASVKRTLSLMEDSVLRNPDAFMLLRRLKTKDSYAYAHCIDTSMLAIAFGRQLGLPRQQIQTLGLGALLADVGKMKLPKALLTKPDQLSDEEFAAVKRHVEHSVQTIKTIPEVPEDVVSIAASHHERIDGTGYPAGLRDAGIPLYARIVGIVDTFDAMTSERPYAAACSGHEAVKRLYEWRLSAFQEELVEQFIQMLGIYPVGSVVELTTGEVGIIVGQNRVRRLRPKVMLILDVHKQPLEISPIRDLMTEGTTADGIEIRIARTLEPDDLGLDLSDYYI